MEERVGRAVETGEGETRWGAGSADVLEVAAFDGLRIGVEVAAGIFG